MGAGRDRSVRRFGSCPKLPAFVLGLPVSGFVIRTSAFGIQRSVRGGAVPIFPSWAETVIISRVMLWQGCILLMRACL
jgi:hypothetical protein